jgi:glyoxylase-like metal-dependent hydrolase (beta-lactamase superfamily II)
MALSALIAAGALSLAVAAYQQPQGPKVIQVDKLKDNLFVLKGGGGNTAVFVGSNGVVVVDTKNPGWGQPILDKIKELTPKPVTMIINTHTHGDHVSGNVEFPATVDVVVQENTKANMEKMDIFKQNNGKGMPKRTFKDRMTVGKGADQIDLYYYGRGHTNGDAWVVFPQLHVVHAGDIFASKNLPLIDTSNGGSAVDIGQSLQKAHDGIKNVDTIITGHSATTMTWQDLQDYATFNKDFVGWVEGQLKAGKSVDDVAAATYKVPDALAGKGFTANPPALFGGMKGMVQGIADEMKK